MKSNENKYPALERLPDSALTVKKFAELRGISTAHVYKLYNQGRATIVVYQGVNFVLPNGQK